MDLETILFTVIEGIVLFVAVYFFFSNIKIRGETKNQYLPLLGELLFFGLFIFYMIGFYYSTSLHDLLFAFMFLQIALIAFYRKSFDRKLLSFGVAVALISDFILAYSILNPSQPTIFSYGILAILLFYTATWAIMVVEKIRGRSFSWMENLFEPKWMDER